MDKDISEIIGWKCSCGQSGNMGKFCVSCGKVQPLVGAQRAVPDQIAVTLGDGAAKAPDAAAVNEDAASKSSSASAGSAASVSAVSEYYDYSGESADPGASEENKETDSVDYTAPAGKGKGKGLSIAGMVTGIVSCALFFVPVLGVSAGITGMIMTIKAKERGLLNGFTSTGTICSAIGCAVGYLVLFRIFF